MGVIHEIFPLNNKNKQWRVTMEEKDLIKELSFPLFKAKGWLKLVGVMSIIYGVLTIFSVVGIIICWLPIWMGVLLFKAGNKIEEARAMGDKYQLLESLDKLKTYFVITGVLTLIGIIVFVIALAVGGGTITSILNSY